jgi:putative SOS response-associated peptidase YedK
MCFTIAIHLTRNEIEKRFGARFRPDTSYEPAYYRSAFDLPEIPVITDREPSTVELFQWGLIPFWVKDAASAEGIQKKTFNARAESVAEKPSFRNSLRNKRCLVVSRGFFEWQLRGNEKIPHYICLEDENPFVFAGIYDNWTDRDSGEIRSTFSIITTAANPLMDRIHNTKQRMPVILPREAERQWLDRDRDVDSVLDMLRPYDERLMKAYTISKKISMRGVEKNVPDILEPFDYDDPILL